MSTPVGPVIYQVLVNGVLVTDFILDVKLDESWGSHDIFTLRIEYQRASNMNTIVPWADNAPVQIVWGRRPDPLNNWYGYVNHKKLSSNADSGTHNLQYTYYCIGMSKPMNTDVTKVWGNVTPTYIAKTIALKYSLRCVVTSTAWVLSSEVQAAESDFCFLNRIADKTGYRFWVSNGTLYFINPAVVLIGAGQQVIPTYTQDKLLDQQDTIRNFDAYQGDNLPGSATTARSIYGIDPTSGQVFQAGTSTPGASSIQQVNTARVATSYGEGQRIVDAWQGLSQFWVGASAELFGSTVLYPGKVVLLTGQALPGGNAGYWIVGAATHLLKMSGVQYPVADKYVTQVQLLRNTSSTVPSFTGTTRISPEFVPCVNRNGVWTSSNLSVIYDGVTQ